MEMHFHLDDAFLADMKSALNVDDPDAVMRDALIMLKWAVGERRRGRLILSADANGAGTQRLAMPSLDAVTPSDN
jgi:hypothetical protein